MRLGCNVLLCVRCNMRLGCNVLLCVLLALAIVGQRRLRESAARSPACARGVGLRGHVPEA